MTSFFLFNNIGFIKFKFKFRCLAINIPNSYLEIFSLELILKIPFLFFLIRWLIQYIKLSIEIGVKKTSLNK